MIHSRRCIIQHFSDQKITWEGSKHDLILEHSGEKHAPEHNFGTKPDDVWGWGDRTWAVTYYKHKANQDWWVAQAKHQRNVSKIPYREMLLLCLGSNKYISTHHLNGFNIFFTGNPFTSSVGFGPTSQFSGHKKRVWTFWQQIYNF